MAILLTAAKSKLVDRALSRLIKWALKKWTTLDANDYVGLLKLAGEYMVTEIQVREGEWLVGKNLGECRLPEEGIIVLGIHPSGGNYVGVPHGDTEIYPNDRLIIYPNVANLIISSFGGERRSSVCREDAGCLILDIQECTGG